MKIRQIEAFQAVMVTGSITQAGKRLSVSQPAVSQLITQFESACGFPLFIRTSGGIRPTLEAEALYVEVQRTFSGINHIARVAKAINEKRWGMLSIGAFPAIARRFLPESISNYCSNRPDVRIQLVSLASRDLIDAVASQQLNFGLSVLASDRPEVESFHLHRLRGMCIMPAEDALAGHETVYARDLAGKDFISLGSQDHSRFIIDRIFDDLNIPLRSQIEVAYSDACFAFVAAKAGVAIVDPFCLYNNIDHRVIARPFEPTVEFDVWLIRPKAIRTFNLISEFSMLITKDLARFAANLESTQSGAIHRMV